MVKSNAPKPSWCGPLWLGNHRFCASCWRRSWSALWPVRGAARPAVCTHSARPAYIPGRPLAPAAPPDITTSTKQIQGLGRDFAIWKHTESYLKPQYASKCSSDHPTSGRIEVESTNFFHLCRKLHLIYAATGQVCGDVQSSRFSFISTFSVT